MNASVFFLAAAADSLMHSLRFCVQWTASLLRPPRSPKFRNYFIQQRQARPDSAGVAPMGPGR